MIPFLPFLLNDLLPSPELDLVLDNNYPNYIARLNFNYSCVSSSAERRTPRNTPYFIVPYYFRRVY
jgi:hypothetical protein